MHVGGSAGDLSQSRGLEGPAMPLPARYGETTLIKEIAVAPRNASVVEELIGQGGSDVTGRAARCPKDAESLQLQLGQRRATGGIRPCPKLV